MKCIVIVDKDWGIGKDGGLLVHLPGDLQYFKEKTLGKVLIMGRKTVESLPGGRPLPGRTTIVLTGNSAYEPPVARDGTQAIICRSQADVETTLCSLRDERGIDLAQDVIAAGGETVYAMFLPQCNEMLVTKIDRTFPADRHFANLDRLTAAGSMRLVWESEPLEENGLTYRFTRYERI